jgi:dehydrogenase/reductase SDR family protein 7B
MVHFDRQRILITGASSGIGEHLAYTLAQQGANLILVSRTESELQRVRAHCQRPMDHQVRVMDLENINALDGQIRNIWNTLGPIDILINNAGISQRYPTQDSSITVDQKIMTVNFWGTVALTKQAIELMLERGSGQIVCVSSLAGLIGLKNRTIYSASKHALRGYFESLRQELYQGPLKITMIYPGYINTNLPQNALLKNGVPNGRQEKTHVGGMALEECARRMTRAIARKRAESLVARPIERLAVLVGRHLPAVFRWLFPRMYSNSI